MRSKIYISLLFGGILIGSCGQSGNHHSDSAIDLGASEEMLKDLELDGTITNAALDTTQIVDTIALQQSAKQQ